MASTLNDPNRKGQSMPAKNPLKEIYSLRLPAGAKIEFSGERSTGESNTPGYTTSRALPAYKVYRDGAQEIDNFVRMTSLSYGLAQHLLLMRRSATPDSEFSAEKFILSSSYAMGDLGFDEQIIEIGWIEFAEYARRREIPLEEIEIRARSGAFGPVAVDPGSGNPVLRWPPEDIDNPDFPEPGIWTIKIRFHAEVDLHEGLTSEGTQEFGEVQEEFLRLTGSLGDASRVAEHAETHLFRSAFLLQWTAFELFVRQAVRALMLENRESIFAGKRGKDTISKKDVVEVLAKSPDIDTAWSTLIDRELSEMRGVHSFINFMKSELRFKNDPYKAWFVYRGAIETTTYQTLVDAKEDRNALIHEGGYLDSQRPIPNTNREWYERRRLTLRSIAFSIARNIVEGAPEDVGN